jgi:hypothetical protein
MRVTIAAAGKKTLRWSAVSKNIAPSPTLSAWRVDWFKPCGLIVTNATANRPIVNVRYVLLQIQHASILIVPLVPAKAGTQGKKGR